MKYCRLQTAHGPQYAEVVERDDELWIERLIPPFEEGPQSDFVDRAGAEFVRPAPAHRPAHWCRCTPPK